jgi:hypothetical protein
MNTIELDVVLYRGRVEAIVSSLRLKTVLPSVKLKGIAREAIALPMQIKSKDASLMLRRLPSVAHAEC